MVYKVVSAQIQNDGRAGLRCRWQMQQDSGLCSGRQMPRSAVDAGRCRAPQTGSVTEGKRARLFQTPGKLEVGGLYFVRPGKLVRILAKVSD